MKKNSGLTPSERKVITMQNQVINMQTSLGKQDPKQTQTINVEKKKQGAFCIHGLPDEHNFCSHLHLSSSRIFFFFDDDKHHAFLSRQRKGGRVWMGRKGDNKCHTNFLFRPRMYAKCGVPPSALQRPCFSTRKSSNIVLTEFSRPSSCHWKLQNIK
jgi:hypothetical protein